MIIIVQRSDMSRMYADLETEKVRLFHFGLSAETTQKAELIVFIDDSKVYVLKADKWPYGKPMSAAELIQYIANHVA
jgi:hypothetical protein